MTSLRSLAATTLLAALALPGAAQHAKVTSIAAQPGSTRVWACNRDNSSVAVVDTTTNTLVAAIPTGIWPRSIAFNTSGTRAFVANQRGNIEVTTHFVTPFLMDGSEQRGTISVIDTATLQVTNTLTDVGTEPYGLAVAPNGTYFAVSGFRSGTIKFYDSSTLNLLLTHQFDRTLDFIAPGKTVADVDGNKDFLADQGEPRAFVITSDSSRLYVTHLIPGFVTALDLTLDLDGKPTASTSTAKIDLNDYPFDVFFNPTPVQTLGSQGLPRFLDDIALSPDGTRALVPHLLHNVNHDVNFNFGPGMAGDFANRVYPALTVVDTTNLSYNQVADNSARLHHELTEPLDPAAWVPFGPQGAALPSGAIPTLAGSGTPVPGQSVTLRMEGAQLGDISVVGIGPELPVPINLGPAGNALINAVGLFVMNGNHELNVTIPAAVSIPEIPLQGLVFEGPTFTEVRLSQGLYAVPGSTGYGTDKMGHRAGHPSRVLYNAAGDRALLLNRGSEDVFLYSVNGSSMELLSVFPPRHDHVERTPGDTSTPLGDMLTGMTLVEDASTPNDDALLYVMNENTRTMSTLRVDFGAGVITQEAPQLSTLSGPDKFTAAERIGEELFEDSSRAQTAGRFNNSCASCHFEGGADGNVWQRPAGPRSTMPVYGGPLLTGLVLWKGVRLNMGETGPMFGGENGGTGIFTDAEEEGLRKYHRKIAVPLNPNIDPVLGTYSAQAALGKDLYFGTNDTGLNNSMRNAGCATCHPDQDPNTLEVRGYTADVLPFMVTADGEFVETEDPNCFSLQENTVALNLRDVNTGVNIDFNPEDGLPDVDRNNDLFSDLETYTPMNVDDDDDFMRDDPNSYACPPGKVFKRDPRSFSIPTKLGVFSSGPYFHDHSASSLRTLLDPEAQAGSVDLATGPDPVYGDASFPMLQKVFSGEHDVRGHNQLVGFNISKVQLTLQSTNPDADIEALLAYISSL